MSLASICTRPVILVRRARTSGADPYGEDTLEVVEELTLRVHLHQRTSDEPAPGEQATNVTRWAMTVPPGTAIGRDDLVAVGGELFELDGDPFPAWAPLQQATHHYEVGLVQVVG